MFQAATVNKTIQDKCEGDVKRIEDLGCLACRLPGRFDEIIRVAKEKDLGAIKDLGESWLSEASAADDAESGDTAGL